MGFVRGVRVSAENHELRLEELLVKVLVVYFITGILIYVLIEVVCIVCVLRVLCVVGVRVPLVIRPI